MAPFSRPPVTRNGEVSVISNLRRLVKAGAETDCDALADYVDAVAEGLQNSKSGAMQLKLAISLLTPNRFPVPLVLGVTGNPNYQALNRGSSPSGFQSQLQAQIPNAEQAQRSAALFQRAFRQ